MFDSLKKEAIEKRYKMLLSPVSKRHRYCQSFRFWKSFHLRFGPTAQLCQRTP